MDETRESMTCTQAHEALLAVNPAELGAGGSGPLAAHLRTCTTCRRQAAAIVHGTAALRAAIDEIVAERVVAARAPQEGARRVVRRRLRPRLLLPLGLAAALAAIIAVDRGVIRVPREPALADVHHPEPVVPTSPVVNAVDGGGVAVMTTSNPRITVVWSF